MDPTKGYDWIEGVAIIVAVVVVVLVTAINDWSKERQFRGLKKNVDRQHRFSVVRDAQTIQLVVADIVVGDVCIIKYGNLRRSLQLRFNYDSTAVRRPFDCLSTVIKDTLISRIVIYLINIKQILKSQ